MLVRSNGLINLLHSSYCLLFLHLPPLVLKIIEFMSYGRGPFEAPALQVGVEVMTTKDTLEFVTD